MLISPRSKSLFNAVSVVSNYLTELTPILLSVELGSVDISAWDMTNLEVAFWTVDSLLWSNLFASGAIRIVFIVYLHK